MRSMYNILDETDVGRDIVPCRRGKPERRGPCLTLFILFATCLCFMPIGAEYFPPDIIWRQSSMVKQIRNDEYQRTRVKFVIIVVTYHCF